MDARTHLSENAAQIRRVELTEEVSNAFSLDDLCRFASHVAGVISGRFVSFPDGQPSAPFHSALYDRESAANLFEHAAEYIRNGPHEYP